MADRLRIEGNEFFKDKCYKEASDRYREALAVLTKEDRTAETASLGQALRLNLANCHLRLDAGLEEAISLCDAVLASDPTHTKAMFRRASLRFHLSRHGGVDQRGLLSTARKDALQAAKNEPSDRQIRELLDEITEQLRKSRSWNGGFVDSLYERECSGQMKVASEPIICSTCGRVGHPCCGKAFWVTQRALWLGMPEDEVGRDPGDFEDNGTLRDAIMDARGDDARRGENLEDCLSDLSDEEREDLETCLESTERPYPQPKKKLPLVTAIRCAEEIWAEDS